MEKKQTMRRFAGIFGLSVCLCAPLHAQDSATYEMTFQGLWTADDITDSSLPSGAHFTEVIGAKHNSSTRIWRNGGTASEGVEGVAEFGSTGTLRSEINSNANTDGIISAGSTNNGPISAVSTTFNINSSHPLVSVLSMIAPTSDWFVGIDSVPLRQNGAWRDRVQLDLYPYDAGTENGNAWRLRGGNVDPHETITSIRNTGRFRDNPLARITFQLQTPAASNVSIADASVAEGDSGETDLSFTVQLDRASSGDISLDWATSTATGDTAAAGADYTAANGSLTFSAGEMSKSVTVKVQGDTQAESNETFTVTLSNLAGNGTLPSPATATGTIIDDDAAPPPATAGVTAAQPSDTMVAEGDTTNTATFTVVLDSQPSSAVTVTVTAAAGLELDGPDSSAAFTASEALAFAANAWDSAQTVTVRATDDSTDSPSGRELAVTYRTASSDSAYSGLAGTAATVAVTDDDATTATLAGASGNIEEGATKTFTVTLSRALAGGETLAVPLTFSGTAARNADYTVACASAAGVACANLNTGSNPRVTFTGPAAASVTLTLTADDDSAGETVDIGLGTLNAASGTGLDGGASGADNLAIFSIIAPAPTDTTAPTLSISGVPERINDRAPFTATFSFSEAVTGFDATDVTVDGGTAGALSGSGDAYTMTITPTGGDDVTVTVAADAATDGSNNSGPETAVSETAAWDPGSLAVSEASLMLDEGGSASYTVALDTEPLGPVTVAIAAPDGAGVELSPSSLAFDADDWDTPQRVTVSALEDDDLADESGVLSHSASGGGYDGVSAEVSVAVSDDDMASLAVSESSLALDEGGSATYTVALGARPSGDVTVAVAVSGSGVEVSPDSLAFSANNWSAAQSVTVTALEDDDVADASASLAHAASGGSYDGVSAEVAVAVSDNDEGSLALSESSLALDEGGGATYTVALGARPSGDVTVAVAVSGSGVEVSPDSLAFSANNWSAAQSVTVTALEDDDVADATASLAHAASGGSYDGVSAEVAVAVSDNDEGSLALSESSLSLDEGGSATYTVALGARPSGTVTVAVTVDDGAALDLSPDSLTFGADAWNTPQSVTVSAPEDDDVADATASLAHSASGGSYDGVSAEVAVAVSDNDEGSLALSESSLSLDEGGSATYTVALGARPSGTVTVAVTVDDGAALDLSPDSLTFGADAWNTPQSVTVSAPEDDDVADATASLAHSASGGSYDGVSAEVAVAVSDNDEDVSGASTAWMARFGRVVSEQILEGIGDRVGARRQLGASPPQDGSNSAAVSFEAMFAGQRLGDGSLAPQRLDGGAGFGGLARPGPGMLSTQPPVGGSSIWPAPVFGADGPSGALPPTGGPREDRSLGSMMRAALVNSAFNASGQTSGGAAWGVWGRGSVAALEGRSADGISIDGDVTTGQLGADWAINNWLLGLSASYSQGDGDYAGPDGRGALESTMAALTPYLSVDAGRFSAWGALSTGRGDMTVIPQQGLAVKADIEMEMGAVGLRGELLDFGDGFSLSLISDAMAMRSSSEAATGMPAAEADASRVRAAVEASWTRPLAGGGRFSARLEGGARLDGGDAEEGAGAEVSAGLSWMQDGLIFELEGRHLIAHEDEDFSQTGASAHLAWNSQPSSGLGPSLSVRQHWGIATASGLDQLFALRDLGQFGLESGGRRLDTEIGWGLPLLGGRFAGTPFLLHGAQDGGSLQTLGWRMEPLDLGGKAMDMSMSFKLMRRARIADGPDRGVALEARVGF